MRFLKQRGKAGNVAIRVVKDQWLAPAVETLNRQVFGDALHSVDAAAKDDCVAFAGVGLLGTFGHYVYSSVLRRCQNAPKILEKSPLHGSASQERVYP